MNQLTVIIPVGPTHATVVKDAIASVEAQTVDCEIIVIYDTEARGAGWARNQGLNDIEVGDYITFLDADDVLEPTFAETCLGVLEQYRQAGHTDPRYVYTDWYGINSMVHLAPSPCEAWTNKTSHLVTTVIPTLWARRIGGFDEQMRGVEDADFYVRLRLAGLCGLHVNAPLVQYREGGGRSVEARTSGEESAVQSYMTKRYGGYTLMGCCGDNTPGPVMPDGEPPEGYVLVQAQWGGNRQMRGLVTGNVYPRTSYPKFLYVDERDAQQSPNNFKQMRAPVEMTSGVVLQPQYQRGAQSWQAIADGVWGGGVPTPAPSPVEYHPNITGKKKSDVLKQVKTEGGEK